MSSSDRWSVAAVVLTRNRRDSLRSTLSSIVDQTRAPDTVIVVDNASTDDTAEMLQREFPDVKTLRTPHNLGAAGGRSHGLRDAFEHDHDAVWFVDDDSTPVAASLARTLDIAHRIPNLGMLGQMGGTMPYGIIRHDRYGSVIDSAAEARRVDFVLTDGALVTRAAYERAGALDGRYFIMMEDIEYPLRIAREGLVVARAELGLSFHHLGASGGDPGAASAPWRLYYQTRNHLRMAIEARSPKLLFGWLYRQLGGLAYLARQPENRRQRLRYRWQGTLDALRNRMGEVVPPP